jgi:hypothetical protein
MGLGDILPAMWAECEAGNGMHFTAAPDVLVELIDPATLAHVPWEPGATGEAVYTTLTREASAVVRFRSRDQLLVTGVDCAYGRSAPTIRCVGRTDDMLDLQSDERLSVGHPRGRARSRLDRLVGHHAHPQGQHRAGAVRHGHPARGRTARGTHRPGRRHAAAGRGGARAGSAARARVEPVSFGEIPISDYKNALVYTP